MSHHARARLVVACACTVVAACASVDKPVGVGADAADGIKVLSVEAARYTGGRDDPALQRACLGWRLTPMQVIRFFQLATTHDDAPYSGFYYVPCAINGELRVAQHQWSFSIGGGGTAVWRSGKQTLHWGCTAADCAPLVLLLPDGLDPK